MTARGTEKGRNEGQKVKAGGKVYEEICTHIGITQWKSYARSFKEANE